MEELITMLVAWPAWLLAAVHICDVNHDYAPTPQHSTQTLGIAPQLTTFVRGRWLGENHHGVARSNNRDV